MVLLGAQGGVLKLSQEVACPGCSSQFVDSSFAISPVCPARRPAASLTVPVGHGVHPADEAHETSK